MKRIFLMLITFLAVLESFSQSEPIKTAEGFEVKILTSAVCDMCKYTIEKDLAFEKGVKSSDLDVESKVLTVVYNERKTDADKIRKRIAQVGYHADNIERDKESYNKLPYCCQDGAHGRSKPHNPDKMKDSQ